MKFKSLVAAAALGLTTFTSQAATVLLPSDGHVNLFTDNNIMVGVYDAYSGSPVASSVLDALMAPSIFGLGATVDFVPPSSPGATSYFAVNSSGTTLALGSTNEFSIAISLDGGISWLEDDMSKTVYSTNGDIAQLIFNLPAPGDLPFPVEESVIAVDVAPVPLPAAAWLFGAGLLGLVGVARRKLDA